MYKKLKKNLSFSYNSQQKIDLSCNEHIIGNNIPADILDNYQLTDDNIDILYNLFIIRPNKLRFMIGNYKYNKSILSIPKLLYIMDDTDIQKNPDIIKDIDECKNIDIDFTNKYYFDYIHIQQSLVPIHTIKKVCSFNRFNYLPVIDESNHISTTLDHSLDSNEKNDFEYHSIESDELDTPQYSKKNDFFSYNDSFISETQVNISCDNEENINPSYDEDTKNKKYCLFTNYLSIRSNGKVYTFGNIYNNENKPDNYIILEKEEVNHPCIITGYSINSINITSLQIVDFDNYEDYNINNYINNSLFYYKNYKKLEYNENIFLNNDYSKHSYLTDSNKILELKKKFTDNPINRNKYIMIENIKIINFINKLFEKGCISYYCSEDFNNNKDVNINIDLITIISLGSKDISEIIINIFEKKYYFVHSFLRIKRHFNYLLYNFNKEEHVDKYRDYYELKVIHDYINILVNIIEITNEISRSNIELNCYQIAYLSNKLSDKLSSTITFIFQIYLTVLLSMSFFNNKVYYDGVIFYELLESRITIPIIFLYNLNKICKQIYNTKKFLKCYTHNILYNINDQMWLSRKGAKIKYTINFSKLLMLFFDIIVNIFISVFNLILNIYLIGYSNTLIEIVLNSIATLFIIELDDNILYITEYSKDYLKYDYLSNIHKFDIITYNNNFFKRECFKPEIFFKKII